MITDNAWCLVTGGTGTVGGALVRELLRMKRRVRVLSRDEGKLAEFRDSFVEGSVGCARLFSS